MAILPKNVSNQTETMSKQNEDRKLPNFVLGLRGVTPLWNIKSKIMYSKNSKTYPIGFVSYYKFKVSAKFRLFPTILIAFTAFVLSIYLTSVSAHASIFGEETAVLLQVVANQLTELQRLAENVGIAKNQIQLLYQINEGVQKATSQIQALQSIIERSQGVDPTSVKSLSDLNRTIEEMNAMSSQIHDLVVVKLILCNEAIDEAGMQSDTAYKMGQELVRTGTELAKESEFASPGRAQQISASASAAQMLAAGVELQTLAQMSQLLALSLDLQKTQMQKEIRGDLERKSYFRAALSGKGESFGKVSQPKRVAAKSSRKE